MDYKLSVLIPTLPTRAGLCLDLVDKLLNQIEKYNYPVEVVTLYDDGTKTIGAKRNELIEMAKGEYVCFFDDDDTPGNSYIDSFMTGINLGVDCISLRGVITWDGSKPEIFEHSIKYDSYKTNDTGFPRYERYPNHLNCIKKSIAEKFKFPEINHGEDTDWATQIKNSGLIKTEHYVDAVTYHYKFITNK